MSLDLTELVKSQVDLLLSIRDITTSSTLGIASLPEIAIKCDRPYGAIQLSIHRLHKNGWVERVVRGGYKLSEGAESKLEEILGHIKTGSDFSE